MRLKSLSLHKFSNLLHSVGMNFTGWADRSPHIPYQPSLFSLCSTHIAHHFLNIWFGLLCYCFCSYYSLCLKSALSFSLLAYKFYLSFLKNSLSFSLLAYKFYLSFKTHLRFFLQLLPLQVKCFYFGLPYPRLSFIKALNYLFKVCLYY